MAVTEYMWNPLNDTVLQETDGAGDTQAVYHSDPVPYGRLYSMLRNGHTSTHRYDAQGNTIALTNEAGQTSDTYRYDAWGSLLTSTGVTKNPYRFGGRVGYQSGTDAGHVSIRARVLGTAHGRWLSVDPFRHEHAYTYAANSPVNYFDPSGLQSEVCAPRIPVPLPKPRLPAPTPPRRPECLKDTVCSLVDEWMPAYCNNKCLPPCTCEDSRGGHKGVSEKSIRRFLAEAIAENSNDLKAPCSVTLLVKAECAIPGFAITCTHPSVVETGDAEILICIPLAAYDYCRTRALVFHEVSHAVNICKRLSRPTTRRQREDMSKRIHSGPEEGTAYRYQCETFARQKCLASGTTQFRESVRECLAEFRAIGLRGGGANPSTGDAIRSKLEGACGPLWKEAMDKK